MVVAHPPSIPDESFQPPPTNSPDAVSTSSVDDPSTIDLVDIAFDATAAWYPTYVRTRHKNLRCFPCCLPQHKERSFCGLPIQISVSSPSGDKDLHRKVVILGSFRRKSDVPLIQVGEKATSLITLAQSDETILQANVDYKQHLRNRTPGVSCTTFLFQPNRKWQYISRQKTNAAGSPTLDPMSRKPETTHAASEQPHPRQQEDDLHVFTAYAIHPQTHLCIAVHDSPHFGIVSAWKQSAATVLRPFMANRAPLTNLNKLPPSTSSNIPTSQHSRERVIKRIHNVGLPLSRNVKQRTSTPDFSPGRLGHLSHHHDDTKLNSIGLQSLPKPNVAGLPTTTSSLPPVQRFVAPTTTAAQGPPGIGHQVHPAGLDPSSMNWQQYIQLVNTHRILQQQIKQQQQLESLTASYLAATAKIKSNMNHVGPTTHIVENEKGATSVIPIRNTRTVEYPPPLQQQPRQHLQQQPRQHLQQQPRQHLQQQPRQPLQQQTPKSQPQQQPVFTQQLDAATALTQLLSPNALMGATQLIPQLTQQQIPTLSTPPPTEATQFPGIGITPRVSNGISMSATSSVSSSCSNTPTVSPSMVGIGTKSRTPHSFNPASYPVINLGLQQELFKNRFPQLSTSLPM